MVDPDNVERRKRDHVKKTSFCFGVIVNRNMTCFQKWTLVIERLYKHTPFRMVGIQYCIQTSFFWLARVSLECKRLLFLLEWRNQSSKSMNMLFEIAKEAPWPVICLPRSFKNNLHEFQFENAFFICAAGQLYIICHSSISKIDPSGLLHDISPIAETKKTRRKTFSQVYCERRTNTTCAMPRNVWCFTVRPHAGIMLCHVRTIHVRKISRGPIRRIDLVAEKGRFHNQITPLTRRRIIAIALHRIHRRTVLKMIFQQQKMRELFASFSSRSGFSILPRSRTSSLKAIIFAPVPFAKDYKNQPTKDNDDQSTCCENQSGRSVCVERNDVSSQKLTRSWLWKRRSTRTGSAYNSPKWPLSGFLPCKVKRVNEPPRWQTTWKSKTITPNP